MKVLIEIHGEKFTSFINKIEFEAKMEDQLSIDQKFATYNDLLIQGQRTSDLENTNRNGVAKYDSSNAMKRRYALRNEIAADLKEKYSKVSIEFLVGYYSETYMLFNVLFVKEPVFIFKNQTFSDQHLKRNNEQNDNSIGPEYILVTYEKFKHVKEHQKGAGSIAEIFD